MSFDNIKGQKKAINILQNSIQKNRVSQSYLFYGPKGIGKYKTALSFSKALNCENLQLDSCENCTSCRKISNYNHPDVYIINSDGAKSSIKIDDIRQLQSNISLKSYESEKNICIVRDADRMTVEANNSLLKSLEDASYNTIIILIASNLQNILPTVISRCLIVRFDPLKEEIIKDILSAKRDVSHEQLSYVVKLAEGSLEKAQLFLDSKVLKQRGDLLQILGSPNRKKLLFYEPKYKSREEVVFLLDIILSWYRDILLLKNNSKELIINIDKREILKKNLQGIGTGEVIKIMNNILRTRRDIQNNANIKLAMYNSMRRICKIEGGI